MTDLCVCTDFIIILIIYYQLIFEQRKLEIIFEYTPFSFHEPGLCNSLNTTVVVSSGKGGKRVRALQIMGLNIQSNRWGLFHFCYTFFEGGGLYPWSNTNPTLNIPKHDHTVHSTPSLPPELPSLAPPRVSSFIIWELTYVVCWSTHLVSQTMGNEISVTIKLT